MLCREYNIWWHLGYAWMKAIQYFMKPRLCMKQYFFLWLVIWCGCLIWLVTWQVWYDRWDMTHVMWHMWCDWHEVTGVTWQVGRDRCDVTDVRWQVWHNRCDRRTWHVWRDRRGVTCVTWQVGCDRCNVTGVTWQVWRDRRDVTGGMWRDLNGEQEEGRVGGTVSSD